jgi:tetratricopeptide (TPR) repeat protein
MPVKLLNPAGDEIMRRNGFWPPAGEIQFSTDKTQEYSGVSTVTDVAVGPESTWSIIDSSRQKVFTYDYDGNLLFAFGDKGDQVGNVQKIGAVTYQAEKMLILDQGDSKSFTVFARTDYGNILIQALTHQNQRRFDLAIDDWTEVLKRNSNFDAAYVGIGQAMYLQGEYKQSLEYFEAAYDTENWSKSYQEIRRIWMADYFLVLILIIAAVITGFILFSKFITKVNKRAATSGKKKTFGEEIAYGFYVILHPFDGFWDLKHEKRGSLRASIVYIALTILAFFYQSIGQGYISNPQGNYSSIVVQMISVLVPLILFVLSNWCLTTLFEGEGSFKDIFIAVSYSLLPIPLLIIPCTIASNFLVAAELGIVNVIISFAFIWLGALVFFGTMVTHDYSLGKNFITFIGTIVGMAFIMFIVILFSTLVGKLVGLVANIVTEIQYRV